MKNPPNWMREFLAMLNQSVEMDRVAMQKLVERRITCNAILAAHPTIQVGSHGKNFKVGMLGIFNGFTQGKGWRIEAIFHKGVLTKFQLWPGGSKRVGSRPWRIKQRVR